MPSEQNVSRAAVSYRNGVLTVICGLLVLRCVRELGVGGGSEAMAAREATAQTVPNAAAQRQQIVQELKELKTITKKLGSMEKTVETRLGAVEQRLTEQTALLKNAERRRGRNEEPQ